MSEPEHSSDSVNANLGGTTYKVYRYLLKQNRPVGISDIQKGLGLSSPSVAQYHVRKLLRFGMVREEQEGYVIDKVVFESIIRIGRVSLPTQAGYLAFFGATLLMTLLLLRPTSITSQYIFAVVVNAVAFLTSMWETRKVLKRL
jgi:hypothetical protein